MSHRGYSVHPDMLLDLEAELQKCGVSYRVVDTPLGLGDPTRPVLVTDGVKPDGWTRYRKCPTCGRGVGLIASGKVGTSCQRCDHDTPTAEKLWRRIESATPLKELKLPIWIEGVGVTSVADVRTLISVGELPNVGPERTLAVAEALAAWRAKIIEILSREG